MKAFYPLAAFGHVRPAEYRRRDPRRAPLPEPEQYAAAFLYSGGTADDGTGHQRTGGARDEQWEEVIELCRRYGYLTQETGQSATLMKNASQIKNRGLETYIFLQVQTCGAYPQPGECEGEEDVL